MPLFFLPISDSSFLFLIEEEAEIAVLLLPHWAHKPNVKRDVYPSKETYKRALRRAASSFLIFVEEDET